MELVQLKFTYTYHSSEIAKARPHLIIHKIVALLFSAIDCRLQTDSLGLIELICHSLRVNIQT